MTALKRANEMVFESLKATGLSTQIWVGIDAEFFEGLTQSQSLKKAQDMISFLSKKAQKSQLQNSIVQSWRLVWRARKSIRNYETFTAIRHWYHL